MASQNADPALFNGESSRTKGTEDGNITTSNHSVTKRLHQDLMTLMKSAHPGISAFPDGSNYFKWIGTITGASGTVYEGFTYKLTFSFPSGYPYTAPTVKFETPCFHPNVDQHGNICLDILKEKWSALYDVRTVLLSIQSLLAEPNNNSPLNTQAAMMWSNQKLYKEHLNSHNKEAGNS